MKITITFLISIAIFCSCSNEDQTCAELTNINTYNSESIKEYYSKIELWNLENRRMQFLQKYTKDYEVGFDSLNLSIEKRDFKLFDASKDEIRNEITQFLKYTTEYEPWTNNEYFWMLKKSLNEIDKLILAENCTELNLMQSIEIEKKLISTFYILGYSDQYCFNTMNPIAKTFDFDSDKDSLSFTIGIYAYDSTSCTAISYEVTKGDFVQLDSVTCNWFKIPRMLGINKFVGLSYPKFYGKEQKQSFSEEVHVR